MLLVSLFINERGLKTKGCVIIHARGFEVTQQIMNVQKFETQWGGKTLSVEIGKLAQQANGSCVVSYGETVVLATAVMSNETRDGIDFFPLSVEFDEKLYAAGIIKGSRFIKREGRPSDEAILTGRLIDRSIRPLFNESLRNEVQVIVSPISFDEENDPDVIGTIAASIALAISDIPWGGPLAAVRVGRIQSETDATKFEWVLNPTYTARTKSDLDLIVCGTPNHVTMIEAAAHEVAEDMVEEAILFGEKHFKEVLSLINTIVAQVGLPKRTITKKPSALADSILDEEAHAFEIARTWMQKEAPSLMFATPLFTKAQRAGVMNAIKDALSLHLDTTQLSNDVKKIVLTQFKYLAGELVTEEILRTGRRVDGRGIEEIRPLYAEVALLPRTHGTGLFMRGETQVMSVATLGSPGDAQLLEGIEGESKKRYMHHYNFPPYSVGEAKPLRGPGRREIGHGALAERAIEPMLPSKEEFPYTIRVVSEVMGSNGSSSMASTCGSSLALMDAGVPLKKTVAGIAMGLASNEKGDWKVITDLQDLEDGHGGMDFKIAGTRDGITAIQMDTKTLGLSDDIIKQTLVQAKRARAQVIETMEKIIARPRAELSPYAPRIEILKINPELIRVVIGPGGKMINEIIDKTGVSIDIEQDGTVFIASSKAEGMQRAVEWVKALTHEIAAGEVFDGKVSRIMDFGAFVEFLPGKEGLVHISELDWKRTAKVTDVVNIGDTVKVVVKEIDDQGRINLSMKMLKPKPEGFVEEKRDDSGERKPRRPFPKKH